MRNYPSPFPLPPSPVVAKSTSWRLVSDARDRDAMMTLTRDLAAPDLTTIEHLDWDHKPTCERGAASPDGPCGARAWALIWFSCPAGVCGSEQLFICHGCWVLGHQPGVVAICSTCWARGLATQHCGIVAVL